MPILIFSPVQLWNALYIEKNTIQNVSKLCGGLYFKRFEELNWAGYTFLKFKVSGLNITSDRLLVDEKNPQMTSFE